LSNKRKDVRNKAKIEFFANNVTSVTGSSQLLTFFDKDLEKDIHILLELGMSQEGSKLDSYLTNSRLLEHIDAKNLDFVIILHNHTDHTGLLGNLVTNHNFNGQIITTRENKAITPVMLSDSVYIIEQDIELLKRNSKAKDRIYKPFYKIQDVETLKDYMIDIPINKIVNLTKNIQIRFLENKHCYGSVSCEIFMKDLNSRVHKLFYSSDLGGVNNTHFVAKSQKAPKNSTISIYESTYGCRDRDLIGGKKARKKELEILEDTLKNTLLSGGSCLLPCFSYQRTPTMLMYIKDIIDRNESLSKFPIIVDGKLTNELLDVFEKICEGEDKENIDSILKWDNLIRIRSYKDTIKMSNDKEPKIVLSSSGMMQAGHVIEWAKQFLPNKKNCIIFCGYSVNGSLASRIKLKNETNQKTVQIEKSTVLMNCQVVNFNSFSSHIMRNDLINYVLQTNTSDYICFVHGSTDAKLELAEDVCKRLDDECVSTKVIIPKKNQVIYF